MYLRNALFNVLTTEERDALDALMHRAYFHAGDLFRSNPFEAIRVRREILEILDDLEPAF